MKAPFRYAASSAVLFLLGACGGGISDGGEPGGEDPVPLATKADALRELSVVAELSGVLEGFSPGAQGGDRDVTSGSKERDFLSFDVEDLDVSFDREIDDQCLYPVQAPAPLTATKLYNGQFEQGDSGTLEDGSRYAYVVDGGSNQAYVTTYREFDSNNNLIYSEIQGSLGTVESLQTEDGTLDVRADYDYSLDSSEWVGNRREDYFAIVKLGRNLLAPYRAFRDGQELTFSGVYSYRTSDCPGSDVTVTTEEVIELQRVGDADYPVGGRLRLAADGKTAVFAFNAGGGATLTINGRTETLSQAQIRAAINDEPC